MTEQLKPIIIEPKQIIIEPKQIIAAAQKIANHDDDAWQYTEAQYLAAVRSFLEAAINNLVYDADDYAAADYFEVGKEFQFSQDFATELVMPEPPEWERQEVQPAIQ